MVRKEASTAANSRFIIHLILMSTVLIVSRLLFQAQSLYEWDSVGYALALDKFDIIWHRPHPPGYIFYVALGRVFYALLNDANFALIVLNIVLSLMTLAMTVVLANRMFGHRVMIFTGWLMVFTPMFWFYGSVSAIYVADALCAVVIGYWCWNALASKEKDLFFAAFFLGFMGGFRQTITVLMMPLFLYVVIRRTRSISKLASLSLVLFFGILCWFLPTIYSTNGLENFMASSGGLSSGGMDKMEIFFNGPLNYYLVNFSNVGVWGAQMIGVGVLLIPWLVVRFIRKQALSGLFRNAKAAFIILWFVPAFAFYLFLFIDKPGYLLAIFPIAAIAIAYMFIEITREHQRLGYGVYLGTLLLYNLWFAIPAQVSDRYCRITFPERLLHRPPQSDYAWDLSYREIAYIDARMDGLKKVLSEEAFQPSTTVFMDRGGAPNWRQLGYYFPEYRTYWPIDQYASGMKDFNAEVYLTYHQSESSITGIPFWVASPRPESLAIELPESTRTILWFMPSYSAFYKELEAEGHIDGAIVIPQTGETIAYTNIDPSKPLDVSLFEIVLGCD